MQENQALASTVQQLAQRIGELETHISDTSMQREKDSPVIEDLLIKQKKSEERLETVQKLLKSGGKKLDSIQKKVRFENEEADLGAIKKRLNAMDEQINQL